MTYNWVSFLITVGQTPSGPLRADIKRVAAIYSNNGYALNFQYKSNPSTSNQDFAGAVTIKTVIANNTSLDNCTNGICGAASRPYLTGGYTYASDGVSVIGGSVTTSASQTTTVTPSTVQAPGESASYVYDGANRVTTVTSQGVTTNYGYSDSGDIRTVTVSTANSAARTLRFNIGQSTLRSDTDETNRTTSYEYDGSARVTKITAPESNFTSFAYDARGNVTSTTATGKTGATLSTSASYPCSIAAACNSPVSTTDARNNTTNYDYDTTSGLPTKITLPSAANSVRPEQRIGYTQIGGIWRPTAISQCMTSAPGNCAGNGDEVKTTIGYVGNAGLKASVTVAAGDNSVSATSAMTYDAMGNQITEDGPLPGGDDTTRYYYDGIGNPLGSVGPDPDGGGPLLRKAVRTNYNGAGQISSIDTGTATDQGDAALTNMTVLQSVVTAYDSNSRPIAQSALAGGTTYAYTQTGYDARSRVTCVTTRMNPSAFTATSDACALGTQGSDGPDRIVRTNYDDANRVLSVVNAWGTAEASTESSSYTANGKVASLTDGNGNVTAFAYDGFDRLVTTTYPGGSYEQLVYDAGGNVTSRRLRDGQVIGYGYDNLNRITSKAPPSPENPVSYSYNLLGGVAVVSRPADGVTQSFAYDALGRLLSETQPFGSIAYQYDAAGRRTRLTWSDGNYVTYEYLATGDVSAIRESGSALLASYGYDSLGRRTSLTRGNGTVTSYGYDAASRLNSLTHDLGGTAYDSTTSFSYNPASQIASQTRSNDAYAWTGALNVDRSYGVNALNQLTSAGGTSLGYDARGNLTTSGSSSYGYTAENLMKTSPNATMYYDALGRLHEYDTTVSTRFVYDGGHIAAEVANPSGAIQRRYVFSPGDDEPLVWYEGNGLGDRRWLVADERGSIVATTNGSGTVMGVNSYDEYGIPASGNKGRFQYTGQAWLPELGMSYYKARIYSPSLGRFMQTDPIGYGDGMNLYNYVGSDPINNIDPSGLTCQRLTLTRFRDVNHDRIFQENVDQLIERIVSYSDDCHRNNGGNDGNSTTKIKGNSSSTSKDSDQPKPCPKSALPIPKGYVTADPGRNRYIRPDGAPTSSPLRLNPAYQAQIAAQRKNFSYSGVFWDLAGIVFASVTGGLGAAEVTVGWAATGAAGAGLAAGQELSHAEPCPKSQ